MKDNEINSMLFRGIIANLANLESHEGNRMSQVVEGERFTFTLAYQPRPMERFAHNYERDKFLHHRDKFILININGNSMVMLKFNNSEQITVYKKPIEYAFGTDAPRVLHILEKLIRKFYDKPQYEDVLQIREVDVSNGVAPNNRRVYYEL